MKHYDYFVDGENYYLFHLSATAYGLAKKMMTPIKGRCPFTCTTKIFRNFQDELEKA